MDIPSGYREMLHNLVISRLFVPKVGRAHHEKNRFLATVNHQIGAGNQQRTRGTEVLVRRLQHCIVIRREIVNQGEGATSGDYFHDTVPEVRDPVPIPVSRRVVEIAG
jgi:hypothetical protein